MQHRLPRVLAIIGLLAPASLAIVPLLGSALATEGCAHESTPVSNATHTTPAAVAGGAYADAPGASYEAARTARRERGPLTLAPGESSFFAGAGRQAGRLAAAEALLARGDRPLAMNGLCPPDMASIDDLYCIDRYEGSLLELLPDGRETPYSPYARLEGTTVRAVSEPHVFPRGYISEVQAKEACARSGKRLCKPREWVRACMGPEKQRYGYGNDDQPHRCNDDGQSPIRALYRSGGGQNAKAAGAPPGSPWGWEKMNAPELNQLDHTLARTGDHDGCTNGYGVFDMVGNLHEWVDDPRGSFQGGYYQDTHLNGDGCAYKTTAHAAWYHDYSTGFRCCADVDP